MKKRLTSFETARTVAEILDKYSETKKVERQTARKLNNIYKKYEHSIFRNGEKKQYRATFEQVLGNKRLRVLQQLTKSEGIILRTKEEKMVEIPIAVLKNLIEGYRVQGFDTDELDKLIEDIEEK